MSKSFRLLCVITVVAATLLSSNDTSTTAQHRRPRKKVRAVVTASAPVPYTVIVGDKPANETFVTLAVGGSTTFLTPEAALQLHGVDRTLLGVSESDEKSVLHAIYVRPVAEVGWTNMIIEMPSGNASFFVRAVKGRGTPGTFTGEVLVRPAFWKEELATARERVSTLYQRLTEVEAQMKREAEAAHRALKAAENARAEGELSARHEGLVIMGRAATALAGKKGRRWAENARVKVAQAGEMVPGLDGYWTLFEVRNDTREPRLIDRVERTGAQPQQSAPHGCVAHRTKLLAKERAYVAVYCEGANAPTALSFSGDKFTLVLPIESRARAHREVSHAGN